MGRRCSRPVPAPYQLLQLEQTLLLHPAKGETLGSGFWSQGSVLGLSSPGGRVTCRWGEGDRELDVSSSLRAKFLLSADCLFCLFPLQPF